MGSIPLKFFGIAVGMVPFEIPLESLWDGSLRDPFGIAVGMVPFEIPLEPLWDGSLRDPFGIAVGWFPLESLWIR